LDAANDLVVIAQQGLQLSPSHPALSAGSAWSERGVRRAAPAKARPRVPTPPFEWRFVYPVKKRGASASGWHRPTSFSLVQNRGVPALGNRVGLTVEQHGKAEPT